MVAFNELSSSPNMTFGLTGAQARRTGYVDWSDIDDFIDQVFPPNVANGALSFGAQFPGRLGLLASRMQIRPWPEKTAGPDTTEDFDTLPTYQRALCTIDYETRNGDAQDPEDPVSYLTQSWTAGGEFLTLPGSALVWDKDDIKAADDVSAGIILASTEHSITWQRVKYPPFSVIRNRIGTVNDAAITFSTGTIAPETLLFLGANLQRQVLTDGARAWKLTYKFSEKRLPAEDAGESWTDDGGTSRETTSVGGWNHYLRNERAASGFHRMKFLVGASSKKDIYKLRSFPQLFQQGS